MAAASRTELVAWLNELLQINYTKVEQCGAGGAYLQVLDSIYLDIPMARVKMAAKHEYEYVANYKIMQNIFKAKKIDHPIPVEKLIKCKMQDNLEFLQWLKRFWDANYPGGEYDAVARRKGAPGDPPATLAPVRAAGAGAGHAAARSAGGRTPVSGHRSATPNGAVVQALNAQVRELSTHLESLEKERDFYFEKLRDIEVLVQQKMETLEGAGQDDETLREIQKILYSTEVRLCASRSFFLHPELAMPQFTPSIVFHRVPSSFFVPSHMPPASPRVYDRRQRHSYASPPVLL
ncbi:calponin homology domain-containing protein [Mycena epipterygia]|nr:calponin homology domain-containing protein [Mycena epipterygia]